MVVPLRKEDLPPMLLDPDSIPEVSSCLYTAYFKNSSALLSFGLFYTFIFFIRLLVERIITPTIHLCRWETKRIGRSASGVLLPASTAYRGTGSWRYALEQRSCKHLTVFAVHFKSERLEEKVIGGYARVTP